MAHEQYCFTSVPYQEEKCLRLHSSVSLVPSPAHAAVWKMSPLSVELMMTFRMFHLTVLIPSIQNSLLFDISIFKDSPAEPQPIFLVLFHYLVLHPS